MMFISIYQYAEPQEIWALTKLGLALLGPWTTVFVALTVFEKALNFVFINVYEPYITEISS